MSHGLRFVALTLLAVGEPASSLDAARSPALVGTTSSFFNAPICRQLGCNYQGVQRMRLEGSGNPVKVYRYGLPGGQQVEVTRYDLPGYASHNLIYNVRYTRGMAKNEASTAAQLASAAAGYPVTAAQVAACWQATQNTSTRSRLIAARGFDDPGVYCFVNGTRQGVAIQVTV